MGKSGVGIVVEISFLMLPDISDTSIKNVLAEVKSPECGEK
jgi:hypothetical protein